MARKEKAPLVNRWWEADLQDIGHAAIAAVNSIQEAQKGLLQRMYRALKAYGGRGFMSGGRFPTNMGLGGSLGQGQRQGPRDNIVYAAIATIQAQMFDMGPPGVTFLTMHGNPEQQARAKLLEQFTDGLGYQSNLDEESSDSAPGCRDDRHGLHQALARCRQHDLVNARIPR